jgi:hypothetical protein
MKIYIDSEYKCHALPGEGLREFDVPFFDGKCQTFIEGYRYIPADETWERADGEVFRGEMIAPWKNYAELYIAQLEYDLADADDALAELGVDIDG